MKEVQPYVYNSWYLLFFLDCCQLCCLDWNNPTSTIVVYVRLYLL